jgi:hypothetical protein
MALVCGMPNQTAAAAANAATVSTTNVRCWRSTG